MEKELYPGKGMVVKAAPASVQPNVHAASGDVTLDFSNADLREVVKVVLSDMLKQNFVIDPGVKGTVSLQTSRPVARKALLPILEDVLVMNGAALLREQGHYRISTRANAMKGSLVPRLDQRARKVGSGYQIQIVPLQYIAAAEMQKILEPFVTDGGLLKVDEQRNLLILGGSSQEMRSWLATVEMFDVDWMKAYSIGLFPLEHAEAKVLAEELGKIIGDKSDGKGGGLIKVQPIERLNALLVIAPKESQLKEMETWIERLDRVGGDAGIGLHVYQVKNRKAAELAAVFRGLFGGAEEQKAKPLAKVAPGLEPVALMSTPVSSSAPKTSAGASGQSATPSAPSPAPMPNRPAVQPPEASILALPEGGVSIVADESNNAILVLASSAQYRLVEAALRRLDVHPLQVLVEASIIEVTLTDELSYGLEWIFRHGLPQNKTGVGTLDLRKNDPEGLAGIVPGFSYAVVNTAGDITGVLNMLASESKINVLSSPSLMVLDNQKASIRVGEQVPVRTSLSTTGTITTEAVEYKDTGVLLNLSPRVNAGGLVTMEIKQEVTDVGAEDLVVNQRSFLQRTIESVVAVQSGQTIVLGGLILENHTVSESGIPGLYKIPVLGKLFGQTDQERSRTELLVLITPKVMRNSEEAAAITEEFRARLKRLQPPASKPDAS